MTRATWCIYFNGTPDGYQLAIDSASITINGLGTYQFLEPTYVFVNNMNEIAGFGQNNVDLFDGPTTASFANWNMLSSIGPLSGLGTLTQWTSHPVLTTGGTLTFQHETNSTTFQATITPTPEPSTLVLLIASVFGLLACAWRRRRARQLICMAAFLASTKRRNLGLGPYGRHAERGRDLLHSHAERMV